MKDQKELRQIKHRISWFVRNKVNAFSPTISPAPKNYERNEIESIYNALDYYFNKGVTEFVVQKKYMGSYCDIYLCKNLEDTYFVSRNGHVVTRIDLDQAKESLKDLHNKFDWTNLSLVIIQSELLPWGVLGSGLIESDFKGYLDAHSTQLNALKNSSLYQKLEDVKASYNYKAYDNDRDMLSPKEFEKKYPSHIRRQYESMDNFALLDFEKYQHGIDVYQKQIDFFSKEESLHFKPFNILKKVFDDGSEEFVNDNLSYSIINEDEYLHFTISSVEELLEKCEEVNKWFNAIADSLEEGIMVKPRTAFIKGLPPAFKIRNNNYLVMIYGVDFLNEFKRYFNKRNTAKKIDCSINDWMLNWELLKVKYKDINEENYYLKNLVYDRIQGETVEMTLDKTL